MAVRITTLAEIQVLSMATLKKFGNKDRDEAVKTMREFVPTNGDGLSKLFQTVGIAREVRINEDWGTQPVYGIGAPTRPMMVPNNYQVSASIQRLQLDTRDGWHYIFSPDYWYSTDVQEKFGMDDYLYYTYLVIRDKSNPKDRPLLDTPVYALMPRSSSKSVSSGDVMMVHGVELVGFKQTYRDILGLMTDRNILTYSRTHDSTDKSKDEFGQIHDDSSLTNGGSTGSAGKTGSNIPDAAAERNRGQQ